MNLLNITFRTNSSENNLVTSCNLVYASFSYDIVYHETLLCAWPETKLVGIFSIKRKSITLTEHPNNSIYSFLTNTATSASLFFFT